MSNVKKVHHLGLGIPTVEAVEALKTFLVNIMGAQVVSHDEESHKVFLRLNPDDVIQLELFLDSAGPSFHVDGAVVSLDAAKDAYPMHETYGLSNMIFIGIPRVSTMGFPIEAAFSVRDD